LRRDAKAPRGQGVQGFSLGAAHPRLKPWTPGRAALANRWRKLALSGVSGSYAPAWEQVPTLQRRVPGRAAGAALIIIPATSRVTSVAAWGPLLRRRSGPQAATGCRKGRWPGYHQGRRSGRTVLPHRSLLTSEREE
jgi:hypothetical protein